MRPRSRKNALRRVTALALCLAAVLLGGGCGGTSPTTKESVLDVLKWSADAQAPVRASGDGSLDLSALATNAPTGEELDKASAVGDKAGNEAREAASELSEDGDLEEAQSLLCELFVEYSDEEESEAFAPWLMGRVRVALELHKTPPEEAEGALRHLEAAAEEAESPGLFVIETASAALCTG